MNRELYNLTWPDHNGDIELSVSHFIKTIINLFQQCVPKLIVIKRKSTSPRFSKELRKLNNRKVCAFKVKKKNGLLVDYSDKTIQIQSTN